MIIRIFTVRLLHIAWGFALLVALLSMPNYMSSMPSMSVDNMMASQQDNMNGESNEGKDSTGSCCDVIAQSSTGCAFLVPQSVYAGLFGGNERVECPTHQIQSIDIEILAPPPKA